MIEWISANSEIIIIVIIAISQACCFLFGKEKTAEKLEKEKKKLITKLEHRQDKALLKASETAKKLNQIKENKNNE